MESWNGYKCNNIDHYVLVIESMDTDTEVRRLSPIALHGGNIRNGEYTDLINGPMDHGWCTSYTCLKRLSTFFTVVASGTNYTIWLSSTTPSHIRFHLLNSDGESSTDPPGSVLIKIWYKDTRRKDAYLDGKYVTPLNEDGTGYRPIGDQYIPTQNQQQGSNYYDYDGQTMYVLVKGNTPVSVKTADVVQLSFSLSVSLEQFFDPTQFLNNLVAVLNIDPSTIRIVNVIAESRRRKRQSDSITSLMVEIGDPPALEIDVPLTPSSEEQFESNELNEFNSIDAAANDSVAETPTEALPTLAPPPTYNNSDGATAPSARDFIEEYNDDVGGGARVGSASVGVSATESFAAASIELNSFSSFDSNCSSLEGVNGTSISRAGGSPISTIKLVILSDCLFRLLLSAITFTIRIVLGSMFRTATKLFKNCVGSKNCSRETDRLNDN